MGRLTPFRELVHRLAVKAQETLYYDIDSSMPEYRNGVAELERQFAPILRGKVKLHGRLALSEGKEAKNAR